VSGEPDLVPRWLRVPAAYAWRVVIIGILVWGIAKLVQGLELVMVALFLALIITAVLKPLADLLDRKMPRPLATGLSLIAGLAVVGGLVTFVGVSVAGQWESLSRQFVDGVGELDKLLARAPAPLSKLDLDLAHVGETITSWVSENQEKIISQAFAQVGALVGGLTAVVLALFCSIFLIATGSQMLRWFLSQVPARSVRRWRLAVDAAWATFSGYTRGIFLVAATNGLFAGIGLAILRVPLAAPIGVLVFIGTFVPILGAAIAMTVAIVVALAARGPWVALIVVLMIAAIGQIEGHLLQPMIMSKQVSLHPVVVAVAVVAGTLVSGLIGAVAAVPIVSVAWSVFSRLRADAADNLSPPRVDYGET